MALAHFLVILLLLLFSCADAGEVGVCYGRVADNLPDQASVVQLLKNNGITMVRIYDTNPDVLRSLANTGLKVMVMLPNENLARAASDPSFASQWAKDNVAAYPATKIVGVAVGNEVFDMRPDLKSQLVQAMINVQQALAQLGLADAVKVSSPIAFSAVDVSFPPSAGKFRDDVAQSVMKPMLEFLQRTGSYLSMNLFPVLAELANPDKIRLDYALGDFKDGVRVDGVTYHSLMDAQLDATYSAMDKLGSSSGFSEEKLVSSSGFSDEKLAYPSVKVHVTETGRSAQGKPRPGGHGRRLAAGDAGDLITVANAQAYNNYAINRVLAGNTGTPLRPDADMDVYIFALFNENQKGGDEMEQNYGLFYPNMTKVYAFDFHGGAAPTKQSWCVANAAVGAARLQAALDFACGNGADCGAIQPGATCFQPDTKAAHASYAFNDYYQRKGRAAGTCDFNGAASVVNQAPDICWSWCVANAAVGAARLQAGLDFACGHGAECGAIQPGAACFQPDTKLAHASYAFNSYYQNKGRAAGACDFNGAGSVVYQPQKVGNCVLPPPNA